MITIRTHLPASGPISRDDIDGIADHTHDFEDEDIQEIIEELGEILGNGIAGTNYLINPSFDLWSRGTTAVALSEGSRTQRADWWFARADYSAMGSGGGGTYATYERVTDSAHQEFLYAAKLTGTTGLTFLDFGQELPARISSAQFPKCTLTLEVENNTGAAITPVVRLDTCDAFENYSTVTNWVNQSVGDAVANATRKKWNVTLDLSAFGPQLRNGALLYVRFNGMGGPGKNVIVYAAKLEIGEAATELIVERHLDEPSGADTSGSTERQFLANSNFNEWLDSSVVAAEDVDNYSARDWWVNPSDGNALDIARDQSTPDAASRYSLRLTGDAGTTGTVDVGQIILPTLGSEMTRQLVFSAMISNTTGGAFQPTLRIDTCNTELSLGTVTNQLDQLVQLCADGAWTEVSHTFDGATLTNLANGARLYLRFPATTLDNNGKIVRIARPRVSLGSTVPTFIPQPQPDFPAELATVRGLKITRLSASAAAITFDEIVLKEPGGRAIRVGAPAANITIGNTIDGAGGRDVAPLTVSSWYYFWVIGRNDNSVAGLMSLSNAAPTMPNGYLYKALVGAVYWSAGSAWPLKFVQRGRWMHIPEIVIKNAVVGVADTYEAASLATGAAPPIAVAVSGTAGCSSAHPARILLASIVGATAAECADEQQIHVPDGGLAQSNGYRVATPFRVGTDPTANQIHLKATSTAATVRVVVTGFELPIAAF